MVRVPIAIAVIVAVVSGASPGSTAADSRSGISWPQGQALPHFAVANHVDAASIDGLPADQQLMFTSLQGIVNRTRPRIYLAQPGDEGTFTWLTNGLGVGYTLLDSPWQLLSQYRDQVQGTVVYDPAVPDTFNVATTLAGLRNALAVSPQLAAQLAAPPYQIPIIEDLRGRFTSRLDAYTWQYEHLWPEATHRMLVALDPQAHFGFLRDYAVANRAMVFWLDANVPGERALFERILGDVAPYTPYLGWFAQDVAGEFSGTQLCSEHSVYVLAADWFSNMTVWSGTRASTTAPPAPPTPALENKIYVTFTMSEGDNLQYNQRRMRLIWGDPGRGSVPINWTTSPLLVDAAPAMLHYYESTATSNDLFMAGPSGAGYINPTPWPDATFPTFTRQTATYMKAAGLNTVYVLNRVDGVDVPLSTSEAQGYINEVKPKGIMIHWANYTETTVLNGTTPQSVIRGTGNVAEVKTAIADASAKWKKKSPLFLSIGILAFNMKPSDLAQIASSLGSDYRVVRADQFFDLARQANGLPAAP
jgi:hypothetical protein